MTQEELDGLLLELEGTLRGLGIPLSRRVSPAVRVNTRAKRRLGCCFRLLGAGGAQYAIEVSGLLLNDPALLRETLCHELLHTCPGCRDHGPRWKEYARRVNEALGTSIRRTVPPQEAGLPPEEERLRSESVKYLLQCEACGREFPRFRMCSVVKAPWRYRCPCGGKLKLKNGPAGIAGPSGAGKQGGGGK